MARNTLSLYQEDFLKKKKSSTGCLLQRSMQAVEPQLFLSGMMLIMSLDFHLFLFNANDTKARVRPLP